MTRFHLRPEGVAGDRVVFDAEEAHHLAHVLRLRPGEVIRALDGRGQELTVRLTRLGGRTAEGTIVARRPLASEPPLHLTLAQGIPRGDKMESILRMATELGVARVVALLTERTVVRLEPGRRAARLGRWRRVVKEAAKQSGRAVLPEVEGPLDLAGWLARPAEHGLLVCFWEGGAGEGLAALPPGPVTRATAVVGPEGGLSEAEVASLAGAGARVLGLGPRILRTETAGPVAVALLQARYGDLGSAGP